MNKLLQKIFLTPKNFILFPFAIAGCGFIIAFYTLLPLYMLVELFVNELRSIILLDSEKDSNGAQVVKNLLGFWFVVIFNFLRAVVCIPLAIFYFMTSVMFTVSSIGNVNENPFAFSI